MRLLRPGHLVACHYAEPIAAGTLRPKSADEVAAEQGVHVASTGGLDAAELLDAGRDQAATNF